MIDENAPQREPDIREVFNALRYMVKTGCQWRMIPNDLPPWIAFYQQSRRWMAAEVFEQIAVGKPDDVIHLLWQLGDHDLVAEFRVARRKIAAKLA